MNSRRHREHVLSSAVSVVSTLNQSCVSSRESVIVIVRLSNTGAPVNHSDKSNTPSRPGIDTVDVLVAGGLSV